MYPNLPDGSSLVQPEVDHMDPSDPLQNPDIRAVLELFPDKDPNMLLSLYNDCGQKKDVLIETLFQSQPEIPNTFPPDNYEHEGMGQPEESNDEDPLGDLVGLSDARAE